MDHLSRVFSKTFASTKQMIFHFSDSVRFSLSFRWKSCRIACKTSHDFHLFCLSSPLCFFRFTLSSHISYLVLWLLTVSGTLPCWRKEASSTSKSRSSSTTRVHHQATPTDTASCRVNQTVWSDRVADEARRLLESLCQIWLLFTQASPIPVCCRRKWLT